MWKFLGPYLRPYRATLILGLVLNAFSGMAVSAQALAPKYLLDDVLLVHGLSTRERMARLAGFVIFYLAVVISRQECCMPATATGRRWG